jgi:hypothetical protein
VRKIKDDSLNICGNRTLKSNQNSGLLFMYISSGAYMAIIKEKAKDNKIPGINE